MARDGSSFGLGDLSTCIYLFILGNYDLNLQYCRTILILTQFCYTEFDEIAHVHLSMVYFYFVQMKSITYFHNFMLMSFLIVLQLVCYQ